MIRGGVSGCGASRDEDDDGTEDGSGCCCCCCRAARLSLKAGRMVRTLALSLSLSIDSWYWVHSNIREKSIDDISQSVDSRRCVVTWC